jgi:hypothetical protein
VISPVTEPATDEEKNKWWNADDDTTKRTIDRDRERRELVKSGPVEK